MSHCIIGLEREMASSGQRTGVANLPLHYGKVPPWLLGRMSQLAQAPEKAKIGDREKLEAFRRLMAWQRNESIRLSP